MIPKPIDSITKADVDLLIVNGVGEGREIEYKGDLPTGTEEDKREFLADISSFANASGGDLIYGVHADKGVPVAANGVPMSNPDQVILLLDNVIRDGIEPRINGIRIQKVDGFPAGPVLVIRIPRSWSPPHMVTFKNTSRFYIRNNAGKHQMDVSEIRSAFALSESLPEKIRQFRDERIGKIYADEAAVKLQPGGRLVMHLIPLASFASGFQVDVTKAPTTALPLLYDGGFDLRHNLDGLLSFSYRREDGTHDKYTLLFRSGRIEAVNTGVIWPQEKVRYLSSRLDMFLLNALRTYLHTLKGLGVPPPFVLMLTILGAKGTFLFVDPRIFHRCPAPIDRDVLLLPDQLVETYEPDIMQILRPVSDALWNAGGFPRCADYDENGKWKPQYS
jgi:hypothetical protein